MKKILFFTIALCSGGRTAMAGHDMTGRLGLGFTTPTSRSACATGSARRSGWTVGIGYRPENDGT